MDSFWDGFEAEKTAFFQGYMQRRKQKKFDEATAGFERATSGMNAHHPLPVSVVSGWKSELHPDKHTSHVKGYNHAADKFNSWLRTPEGEKWNDAQAKKNRRS